MTYLSCGFFLPLFAGLWINGEFVPPDREKRIAATGDISQLKPSQRRIFEPSEDFDPIAVPGPSDWLANHKELGQSFDEFVQSYPNRPNGTRNKLYLLPLGDFPPHRSPALNLLVEFARSFFALEVKLLPVYHLPQGVVTSRTNSQTQKPQLFTEDVLVLLKHRLPKDAYALLGITMTDLYPDPSWNFVFGQASLRDRVGIYSFARYSPQFLGEKATAADGKILLRRSIKILAHETLHMFGLQHCTYYRCIENGSNHLAESDSAPLHLCPIDLRKLQYVIGFDPIERYRRLRAFYRKVGLVDEEMWLDQRLQRLGE
jgi:archaemetzincin